jgi:hypothetical protein
MSFEIKKISLIELEKIFSPFSTNKIFDTLDLKNSLLYLIEKSLENKFSRDKIINLLQICYILNKEEYLEIAKKEIQNERNLKVFINSNNIETGILNSWQINYIDFENLIYNGLLNSCFGYFSSYDESIDDNKTKIINIKKIKLNTEQVRNFLQDKLIEENLKENDVLNYQLKIAKTNYNEAIDLRNELVSRQKSFTFLNADFINKFSKLVKVDNQDLTYEKFIEIVDSDFMLAIDLVINFVNYNFAFDFKKKNQFFVK